MQFCFEHVLLLKEEKKILKKVIKMYEKLFF